LGVSIVRRNEEITMAKNQATSSAHRNGALRDRSNANGSFVKRDTDSQTGNQKPSKGPRREILFPTEPTTISREKIDRAIEQVIALRK
jgi:hypothetical protein